MDVHREKEVEKQAEPKPIGDDFFVPWALMSWTTDDNVVSKRLKNMPEVFA